MTTEEIEKRLKVLEDIEEIKKLHYYYLYWLNALEFEKMIDCFAEDATFTGLPPQGSFYTGKKEIAKMFRAMAESHQRATGSFVAQPVISVEGDRAKGQWFYISNITNRRVFTSEAGDDITAVVPRQSTYDMEYKREDGKWKISKLHLIVGWHR